MLLAVNADLGLSRCRSLLRPSDIAADDIAARREPQPSSGDEKPQAASNDDCSGNDGRGFHDLARSACEALQKSKRTTQVASSTHFRKQLSRRSTRRSRRRHTSIVRLEPEAAG